MLDIVLALDGIADIFESLEIDQLFQSISSGETFNESRSMLVNSTNEITCDPDIENPVRTICQNVDEPACHVAILQDVDGRDKPGHDGRVWRWTVT